MTGESTWSLGVLIGLPVIALILVIGIVVLALAIRAWRSDDGYASEDGKIIALITSGILVFLVIGAAVGFYPYKAEYHQWETTTGRVTDVNSRFIGKDGGGSTQRFVATIEGVGERGCDDTRCATVKVGDVLTLTCKREWQFTGTDGYGCNFVEVKRP